MNKFLSVTFLFLTFLFASLFIYKCGKGSSGENSRSSSEAGTNSISASSASTNADVFSDIITIRKGTKVVLDNSDKCIQILILFNIEQKKWFRELAESVGTNNTNAVSDEKSTAFLEEKKKEFYQSYGLTEKDLIQYNKIHNKEIIDFMDKNPRYKQAYDQSLQSSEF